MPERERANLSSLLSAVSALGAGLALAREVTNGVGLHWDSVAYISVARNLLAGTGFYAFHAEGPFVSWPPLYPLLLAVASLVDVFDPLAVAGPLNAALFGLTILVVGQYLRQRLASRFLVVWAGLAIALAVPLADMASWALTETLFILLVTLALIRTHHYLTGNRTSSLIWAAVFTALAWQTRYLGATLAVVVVLLLLCQRGERPAQRVRRAAGFSLIVAVPMALWLLRNRLVAGSYLGPRAADPISLPAILSFIGSRLWDWMYFDLPLVQSVESLRLVPVAGLTVVAGVLIGAQWCRRMLFDWLPCYVFGGFALTYLVLFLATIVLGTNPYPFQPRYLTPLYLPLLVTATFTLDRFLSYVRQKPALGSRAPRKTGGAMVAALCVWTAGQVEPSVRDVMRANSCFGCRGYASAYWFDSEIYEYLLQNPLEGFVYSNYIPVNLYVDANRGFYYLQFEAEQLQRHLASVRDGSYVVWYEYPGYDYDYDSALLRTWPDLVPVAELADGAIFVVRKNYSNRLRDHVESFVSGNRNPPHDRSSRSLSTTPAPWHISRSREPFTNDP